MPRFILTDRRILLLGLTLVFILVVTRWLLPIAVGIRWVADAGYWFLLLLVVMFGRALWPLITMVWRTKTFGRFEIGVSLIVVLIVAMWTAHEKPGYKILADELMLSGTAMGLHYERIAACPTRVTDVNGPFQILERAVDKRPFAYPFLLATVHDLTGYRPANAFYLNMVLAVVLLGLVYLLGWQVTGNRWAGVAGVMFLSGLPLLAQQATGGGFELLNLVLLTAFALLLTGYLRNSSAGRLEALVFGTLLLASTRYESALFLFPAAAAALIGWARAGRVSFSWPLQLSPIFLVPLLLQNRLFSGNAQAWQLGDKPGTNTPFAVYYLPDNLGHALAFFFDFGGYLANSPVVAGVGLLALPFLFLFILRVVRAPRHASDADVAWALVAISMLAITTLYLLYFWGQFDDPIISRLSLPVHLLMVLALYIAGRGWDKHVWAWKATALLALGGLLFHGLPVMARQAYRTDYGPGMEMKAREEFLASLVDKNVLFIDRDSFFWILHKIPATPVQQAQARREGLAYHLRNHSFQEMFIYQRVMLDEQTGQPAVVREDELGAEFELEIVFERRIRTLQFARISRITAIMSGDRVDHRPVRFVKPLAERHSPAELDKNRTLYLENWIKQLP